MARSIRNGGRRRLDSQGTNLYKGGSVPNLIDEIPLEKSFPKPQCELIFLIEEDPTTYALTECIRKQCRKYENLVHFSWISLEEAFSLLQEKYKAPNETLEKIYNYLRMEYDYYDNKRNIPSIIVARIIKFMILNVMHALVLKKITKAKLVKKIDEQLAFISTEKPSSKKEREKSEIDSKLGSIPHRSASLENDGIISDKNPLNLIHVFLISGIRHMDVFLFLLRQHVKFSAIIQLRANGFPLVENELLAKELQEFLKSLQEYMFEFKQLKGFQNTILMCFSGNYQDENIQIFSDFVETIRKLFLWKRCYLHYLRNMYIHPVTVQPEVPVRCMKIYNTILDTYPPELIRLELIVDALVEEVCYKFNKESYKFPFEVKKYENKYNMVNNLIPKNFVSSTCELHGFRLLKQKKLNEQNNKIYEHFQTFQVHEDDELTMFQKFYGEIGCIAINRCVNILMKFPYFNLLHNNFKEETDIIHTHDRATSSSVPSHEEKYQDAMLLYLFNSRPGRRGKQNKTPSIMTRNLKNFDNEARLKEILLEIDPELNILMEPVSAINIIEMTPKIINTKENIYDIGTMHYTYKEYLPKITLLQKILKSVYDFEKVNSILHEETNDLLVQFNDCFDDFGISITASLPFIRVPLCFKDFCRYITATDEGWLVHNQPNQYYDLKDLSDIEMCDGITKVLNDPDNEAYRYLLQIEPSFEPFQPKNFISYEEIVDEYLMDLPKEHGIKGKCASNSDSVFTGFDYGHKHISISGAVTKFHSLDGVRVKVDNCRFLHQKPKCTVILSCDEVDVICHLTNSDVNQPFNYFINLEDGTSINFYQDPEVDFWDDRDAMRIPRTWKRDTTYVINRLEKKPEINLVTINAAQLNILKGPVIPSKSLIPQLSETNLQEAFEKVYLSKTHCFKVNRKNKFITSKRSEYTIPWSCLVKRIIKNSKNDNSTPTTKRCIAPNWTFSESHRKNLHFVILLPHGLKMSLVPSQTIFDLEEIKQEYINGRQAGNIKNEEYRIFMRSGKVLIKMLDGTLKFVNCNGEIYTFEEPFNDGNFQFTGFKEKDWCLKKLHRLFSKTPQEISISPSRKILSKTETNYLDPKLAQKLLGLGLPYQKITHYCFDGSVTSISGNRYLISKPHFNEITLNIADGEHFFERSDGFRCLLNSKGDLELQFPDGSKITSWYVVDSLDVDGFVLLSIGIKFEHPNYETVIYDAQDQMKVVLKNGVTINNFAESRQKIIFNNSLEVNIEDNKLQLTKTCQLCQEQCNCSLNFTQFYQKNWDPNKEFLFLKDSFNKCFSANYEGKCKRNANYIKGRLNLKHCDHSINVRSKDLFVINEFMNAERFYTEGMLTKKKLSTGEKSAYNIKQFPMIQNKHKIVTEFRRDISECYKTRFLRMHLLNERLCPKGNEMDFFQPKTLYSTFCIIKEIISKTELKNIFRVVSKKTFNILKKDPCLANEIYRDIKSLEEYERLVRIEEKNKKKEDLKETCQCEKIEYTMNEKISNWRNQRDKFKGFLKNKTVPCYFDSELCIMKKNK